MKYERGAYKKWSIKEGIQLVFDKEKYNYVQLCIKNKCSVQAVQSRIFKMRKELRNMSNIYLREQARGMLAKELKISLDEAGKKLDNMVRYRGEKVEQARQA